MFSVKFAFQYYFVRLSQKSRHCAHTGILVYFLLYIFK